MILNSDPKALGHTAQKMKFSIKDFFSKCDHIRVSFTFNVEILKVAATGI